MRLIDKFSFILGKGKGKTPDLFRHYLSVVKKDPEDAKAHLKLAEIYQKNEDKKKPKAVIKPKEDIASGPI